MEEKYLLLGKGKKKIAQTALINGNYFVVSDASKLHFNKLWCNYITIFKIVESIQPQQDYFKAFMST